MGSPGHEEGSDDARSVERGEPDGDERGEPDGAVREDLGDEESRLLKRRLVLVWLCAGSAPAAMVAMAYYILLDYGGLPRLGDMSGHAATAEWLKTLPWWDWRGWSEWPYGGQAIGVNYPPLGHAWIRFTHPSHGQMAAVVVGLLGLMPWGALRLARAMGYTHRAQRAAVAAALLLVAASSRMHWVLSGFHLQNTFFGSWPAMCATALGLHIAAWAALGRRPAVAGAVAGASVLVNPTIAPGTAVVCGVLLVTSGVSLWAALRWAATAGAVALAVCSWWLVPFVAGRERLVQWDVSIRSVLLYEWHWQTMVLASVCVIVAWAALRGAVGARRLAAAAAVGVSVALLAEYLGYLRAERWFAVPILTAVLCAASLAQLAPFWNRRLRSKGEEASIVSGSRVMARLSRLPLLHGATIPAMVLAILVVQFSWIPVEIAALLGLWFALRPPRFSWVWSSVLGWTVILTLNGGNILSAHQQYELSEHYASVEEILQTLTAHDVSGTGGLVYINMPSSNYSCHYPDIWSIALESDGHFRLLYGLYRETSVASEFQYILEKSIYAHSVVLRPDWSDLMVDSEEGRSIDSVSGAGALGARWYVQYNTDCNILIIDLPTTVMASGVTVSPAGTEAAWHRSAAEWWIDTIAEPSVDAAAGSGVVPLSGLSGILLSGGQMPRFTEIPVLMSRAADGISHPVGQAASGVSMHTSRDAITVEAETAGWVWLRVPWDVWWRSVSGTPVHKGGPGHLIVWAQQGTTELRWSVPTAVDAAAAGITAAAVLAASSLVFADRRRRTRRSRRASPSAG